MLVDQTALMLNQGRDMNRLARRNLHERAGARRLWKPNSSNSVLSILFGDFIAVSLFRSQIFHFFTLDHCGRRRAKTLTNKDNTDCSAAEIELRNAEPLISSIGTSANPAYTF